MTKKINIFTLFLISLSILCASKVLFIPNDHLDTIEDKDHIAFHLMKNIMEILNVDFEYEYVTHLEAMQRIDDEENIIIFPYMRPRNMSNRILLSDTLYVATHKVFYNTRIYDYLEINELTDLKTYVVGSYPRYPFETNLRRAGLTVFYSNNNQESMQRLVNQEVVFVIEERKKGLDYLVETEGSHKMNISYYDIDLFPIPFFVAAPIRNHEAALMIDQINLLIQDRKIINDLIEEFFEK